MNNVVRVTLSFIVFIAFSSCSENQSERYKTVKANAEAYFASELQPETSYKFVELDLVDSVAHVQNIDYLMASLKKESERLKGLLEDQKQFKRKNPAMYDEAEVLYLDHSINYNKYLMEKLDSVKTELIHAKNDVAAYTFLLTYQVRQPGKDPIRQTRFIQTEPTPTYEILHVAKEEDDLHTFTNRIPGLDELIMDSKGY